MNVRVENSLSLWHTSISTLEPTVRAQSIDLGEGELIRVEVSTAVGSSVLLHLDQTALHSREFLNTVCRQYEWRGKGQGTDICDGHEFFRNGLARRHESVAQSVTSSQEVQQDL